MPASATGQPGGRSKREGKGGEGVVFLGGEQRVGDLETESCRAFKAKLLLVQCNDRQGMTSVNVQNDTLVLCPLWGLGGVYKMFEVSKCTAGRRF